MITKDIKVLTLLEQHPESLDILLKASPHFSKLKNKVLRKALAGRVTIEQAAAIAGVEITSLLHNLNNPESTSDRGNFNNSQPGEYGYNIRPSVLDIMDPAKIISLDVRPILESGTDPLKNIMESFKKLGSDEVLQIINSFEPVPLYTVLGKKGYKHWTENEDGTYKVYFIKNGVEQEEEEQKQNNTVDAGEYNNVIELDVHGLPAPEPMIKILENLNRIDDNTVMVVHHHREPVLLYPKLEERGYAAECKKTGEEEYKILIARKKS